MKQLFLIVLLISGVVATAQEDTEVVAQQYNLQELTIVKLKKGDKILLENLIFRGGTSFLEKESKPLLEELLEVMKNNPRLKIEIQGHVCCYPNRTNKLSKERAKVVYEYLIDNGIPKSRMRYKDFGGKRPIYAMPEKNEQERIANRRVEIEVLEN